MVLTMQPMVTSSGEAGPSSGWRGPTAWVTDGHAQGLCARLGEVEAEEEDKVKKKGEEK